MMPKSMGAAINFIKCLKFNSNYYCCLHIDASFLDISTC